MPFSAGWGTCFLLIPVPHQVPCRNKSSGYQDHCPLALQSLNGLTRIPSLVNLVTMLTPGLIKTFIPIAIFLLLLFTQQLGLMRWFLGWLIFHPWFTRAHSRGSRYLGSECMFTASEYFTSHASYLLPSLWRCTRQVPTDPLLRTPPAKVSQTVDTSSSSRSIIDLSITDQIAPSSEAAQAVPPALRTSQENGPKELRENCSMQRS